MQKPVDEYQVFADYVALELRSLSQPSSKKKLKRMIQEAILQVSAEDEDASASRIPPKDDAGSKYLRQQRQRKPVTVEAEMPGAAEDMECTTIKQEKHSDDDEAANLAQMQGFEFVAVKQELLEDTAAEGQEAVQESEYITVKKEEPFHDDGRHGEPDPAQEAERFVVPKEEPFDNRVQPGELVTAQVPAPMNGEFELRGAAVERKETTSTEEAPVSLSPITKRNDRQEIGARARQLKAKLQMLVNYVNSCELSAETIGIMDKEVDRWLSLTHFYVSREVPHCASSDERKVQRLPDKGKSTVGKPNLVEKPNVPDALRQVSSEMLTTHVNFDHSYCKY
ncbi:uncharacterized protein LOC126295422 isoform X1 [Schistocerca gregaria]|uniref:uncharacterized protein LOC126295422 isoform X1 n=3 Tax=Schistocerca gregaria TaxID=7010 RepID=UPI00211E212C|nr:uncharacterized protein LOC126295422 isoform X1 [Schistocerca gregaria]XP_049843858.1 uncharacterized protein LOC126295422 isoform X1 [Schistocerca gregaria]XP_049843859.1 uncharacterized protein LOC126295422 isoform X1 [Schistocerca gregaria]